MLFCNSPHRKTIAIISAIVVVIGWLLWYNTQYRPYHYGEGVMTQNSAGVPMMRSYAVEDTDMEMGKMVANEASMMEPTPSGSVAADVAPEDRLVIKNGSLSLVVDNVEVAIDQLKTFAVEKKGFVVSSNIDQYNNEPTGSVTMRIPADVFDTQLDQVRAIGEVQSENTYGQDVTEEYVDLEARLNNYKATEAQFLDIMKKATKIEDILAVQRELTNVRANIESLEGRMKYLKESAAYSSLTVYLSTNPEQLPVLDKGDTWKPLATVKDALRGLKDLGTTVVDVLIWVVIYLPVWIVLILLVWAGRRWYKKAQHQQ